jgi:hypothetical protein
VLADLLRAAGELPVSTDDGADPMAVALRSLIGRAANDVALLVPTTVSPPQAAGRAPSGPANGFVGCPGLTDPEAFAAGVGGDAMQPRFNDGDIVVFSPAAQVRSGDDCFVRLTDGRTTFRRVFRETADDGTPVVRLQPRNERYRPLTVASDIVVGVCRAVFRYERLGADAVE